MNFKDAEDDIETNLNNNPNEWNDTPSDDLSDRKSELGDLDVSGRSTENKKMRSLNVSMSASKI